MKTKLITVISLALLTTVCLTSLTTPDKKNTGNSAKPVIPKKYKQSFDFFIVSDWGWNGYGHQQEVADQMAYQADSVEPRFIVSCGDNFQLRGVASTSDPLWARNFENVYKTNPLQADWYLVLGNHDYKGNTQAQLDYSKISRRWHMEERYYSFSKKINDSISALFVFLDTPPLVNEYYKPEYPDVAKQDTAKEMRWLKETLANSKDQWKIVFGHHPVFSASHKHGNTPELIKKVKPLFEKYNVQFYFCGHDHDLQHLKEKGGNTEYMVVGTGGETRPNSSNELSIFSASVPAFSMVTFHADSVRVIFMGANGQPQYTFQRKK
jgi:tartrate-resistant acid phosphatase type 5